jgi:hypothetical protein
LPTNYRKAPFSGAIENLNEAATARYFRQLSEESPEIRTPWRIRQSEANPSPERISLLSGKNTGNSAFLRSIQALDQLKAREITALFERIP